MAFCGARYHKRMWERIAFGWGNSQEQVEIMVILSEQEKRVLMEIKERLLSEPYTPKNSHTVEFLDIALGVQPW